MLSLAGRVSNLNEMVEERRDSYLQWRRMNGLDVVDPFGSHSKMIGNAVTDGLLMSIDNVSLSEIAMRITQK